MRRRRPGGPGAAIRRTSALLALAGAALVAWSGYIPAKAALAQRMLAHAWERTASPADRVRPWPWAEIWPVARLTVPRIGLDALVVSGAEGASLAFGPGHVDGTGWPWWEEPGNTVVAGHRDTHFRRLGDLRPGDALWLEGPGGERRRFTVAETRIVHETDTDVLLPAAVSELTLLTCYPFDAVVPGGPLRYLVQAEAYPLDGGPGGALPVATAG